jgi:hypothetical protein
MDWRANVYPKYHFTSADRDLKTVMAADDSETPIDNETPTYNQAETPTDNQTETPAQTHTETPKVTLPKSQSKSQSKYLPNSLC